MFFFGLWTLWNATTTTNREKLYSVDCVYAHAKCTMYVFFVSCVLLGANYNYALHYSSFDTERDRERTNEQNVICIQTERRSE